MKARAAVAYRDEERFRIEDVEIDEPRADEILIRVAGVGVCHTDIVFKTQLPQFPMPAVFGHEGSGIVEAVGTSVTKVKPGDAVVATFRSCGSCDRCESAFPSYCRTMPALNYIGRRTDGSSGIRNSSGDVSSNFFGQSTFASRAIVYERNIVKADATLPLDILGPLGCSVQTGVGAILRSLSATAQTTVAIGGAGAVGLSAVMGAAIASCPAIVVVEPNVQRRELAKSLGATHTIDPKSHSNFSALIKEAVPGGVDIALDTSGAPSAQSELLVSLGSKGQLGLVGVSASGTRVPGEVNAVMTFGHSIRGIIEGDSDPDTFIPELLAHFRSGRLPFDRFVKRYPLSMINEAIDEVHAGRCVKAVLIPDERQS